MTFTGSPPRYPAYGVEGIDLHITLRGLLLEGGETPVIVFV